MQELQAITVDKSDWGDGPWQSEPDSMQWTDEATGLPCLIHRAPVTGALCGYVGVAEGHPAFGVDYDSVHVADEDLDVHGGLTFSAFCSGEFPNGICHLPAHGEPERVWWLGFDCAHSGDVTPGSDAHLRKIAPELVGLRRPYGPFGPDTYKPLAYVKSECARLAAQLAKASA